MPFFDAVALAQRAVVRETAGAVLRFKAERADNAARVADLVSIRTKTFQHLDIPDYVQAGKDMGCEPAVIHAVANAESGAGGFDDRGRMIILGEPHIFSALTLHAFDGKYPWLSYPEWTPFRKDSAPPGRFPQHPYTYDQDNRWWLLAQWAELDFAAGVGAVSAGRFQQLVGSPRPDMGWKLLRYPSPEVLFRKLATSERDQLEVFQRYFEAHGAVAALREKNWRLIARVYNGPGQVERYAGIIEAEYRRCVRHYS